MKKLFCLLAALLMLFSSALAEFDLSGMTPEQLQALIEEAQLQLELSEEKLVSQALDMVKDAIRETYYAPQRYRSNDPRGYLEVLSTRVVYINRDIATQKEYIQKYEEHFSNVYCVIEFVLLSDYMGTAPYYAYTGGFSSVKVYLDGTMEVNRSAPLFNVYMSQTYDTGLGRIVKSISNLGSTYNGVFHLLEE